METGLYGALPPRGIDKAKDFETVPLEAMDESPGQSGLAGSRGAIQQDVDGRPGS